MFTKRALSGTDSLGPGIPSSVCGFTLQTCPLRGRAHWGLVLLLSPSEGPQNSCHVRGSMAIEKTLSIPNSQESVSQSHREMPLTPSGREDKRGTHGYLRKCGEWGLSSTVEWCGHFGQHNGSSSKFNTESPCDPAIPYLRSPKRLKNLSHKTCS